MNRRTSNYRLTIEHLDPDAAIVTMLIFLAGIGITVTDSQVNHAESYAVVGWRSPDDNHASEVAAKIIAATAPGFIDSILVTGLGIHRRVVTPWQEATHS